MTISSIDGVFHKVRLFRAAKFKRPMAEGVVLLTADATVAQYSGPIRRV